MTENAVCVTLLGGKQGKGRDGDLPAQTSSDGGKTWNAAVSVNDAKDYCIARMSPKRNLLPRMQMTRSLLQTLKESASSQLGKTWITTRTQFNVR